MPNDKKLRIFFKTGGLIELDCPEGFDFVLCCQAVRAAGFFNNGLVDISSENINAMVYAVDASVDISPLDGRKTTLQ